METEISRLKVRGQPRKSESNGFEKLKNKIINRRKG